MRQHPVQSRYAHIVKPYYLVAVYLRRQRRFLGYRNIREELEEGRKKPLPPAFGFLAKYIYVPLTIIVLILGFSYNGIG